MIYVSAQRGDDANTGTLAAPCREISKAVELSAASETVCVLDSGHYAQFSVNKSLTVVAEGVHAEVFAGAAPYGNTAIRINAGATDVVVLRGLAIKGMGGTVGIWFSSGTVRVENCTISSFASTPAGFPGYGIQVDALNGVLTVKDTLLRDNSTGIYFQEGKGARATIDRCRLEGNGQPNTDGVQMWHSNQATVADSLVTGYQTGLYIRGNVGSPIPLITLSHSTVSHNYNGVYADRTGQVHLVHSTVTLNNTGLFTLNNGVIYTAGNSAVIGNLTTNMSGNILFFKSDLTI